MKNDAVARSDLDKAIRRHDLDSGIFQGRYVDFKLGKYTDPFIYGRYQLFEEVMSDLNAFPEEARILDLGCGTGHLTKFIKDKGFDVVGLDPSSEMLKFARSNFPDIQFLEGISSDLRFPDDSFDYVICIEVLRYLNPDDVQQSYREIHRVLKPGGKLFVTHVNLYASDLYFLYYHLLGMIKKVTGQFYHRGYFTTPAREEKSLKQAGFYEATSLGRMYAHIRMYFKLGNGIGHFLTRFTDKITSSQSFPANPGKALAGHLILRAVK